MKPITGRRRFLTAAVAGAASGFTGNSAPSFAEAPGTGEPFESARQVTSEVGLETVTDELGALIAVAFAPDSDRLYLAELSGLIYVVESGERRDEPFLDLRDTIEPRDEPGDEQGLLGLTLHPDFADNRRLFVRYSAPRRPEMRSDYSHRFVVAEFQATADGRRAVRESQRTVLELPQPRPHHNAGDLAFGPDGYLYVPVGDSGRRHYGQDVTETLLGGILRIDVDERSEPHAYAVPDDNPLVEKDGLDEYYAWGFRNPWRISFDEDDFFVADVGQSSYEEVNLVERGGNYGWAIKEGTHCFRADDCPDENDRGEPLVDPIIEYPHAAEDGIGVSVIGGHVYRGSALEELDGAYVFGDFLADGRLFVAERPDDDSEPWPMTVVELAEGGENLSRLLSLGRDPDGEVYALGTGENGGGLFRVVPAT